MENIIDLRLILADKKYLAFEDYGEQVFNTYVEDRIDYDRINIIKFPRYLNKVSESFVNGFCKHIALDDALDKIKIKGSSELEHKFRGVYK